jgi:hypothetical protein
MCVQIMAKYMREIFGEKLCVDVDPSLTEMPSPEMLKHKILIKVGLRSSICLLLHACRPRSCQQMPPKPRCPMRTSHRKVWRFLGCDRSDHVALSETGVKKSQPKAVLHQVASADKKATHGFNV